MVRPLTSGAGRFVNGSMPSLYAAIEIACNVIVAWVASKGDEMLRAQFDLHSRTGSRFQAWLEERSSRPPEKEVRKYHAREAARLRALAANVTTALLKTRLLKEAEQHERLTAAPGEPQ